MVKHMKAPFLNRLIIYREKLKKAKVIGDDIKIIQFESLINDAENELNKIEYIFMLNSVYKFKIFLFFFTAT